MTEKLSAEQIEEWRRVIEIVNAPSGPESQKPTWADRVYSRTQLLNRASELLAHIDALQAENEALRATLKRIQKRGRTTSKTASDLHGSPGEFLTFVERVTKEVLPGER